MNVDERNGTVSAFQAAGVNFIRGGGEGPGVRLKQAQDKRR